jgi:hypothetical protein
MEQAMKIIIITILQLFLELLLKPKKKYEIEVISEVECPETEAFCEAGYFEPIHDKDVLKSWDGISIICLASELNIKGIKPNQVSQNHSSVPDDYLKPTYYKDDYYDGDPETESVNVFAVSANEQFALVGKVNSWSVVLLECLLSSSEVMEIKQRYALDTAREEAHEIALIENHVRSLVGLSPDKLRKSIDDFDQQVKYYFKSIQKWLPSMDGSFYDEEYLCGYVSPLVISSYIDSWDGVS